MEETAKELITLEEAIRKSQTMKKNTFIWITKEDIFECTFSKEYAFNSICVMWGRHTYAYSCYLAVDMLPYNPNNSTLPVGTNPNNGYFDNLEKLREHYPKLFNVKGEFIPVLTLW